VVKKEREAGRAMAHEKIEVGWTDLEQTRLHMKPSEPRDHPFAQSICQQSHLEGINCIHFQTMTLSQCKGEDKDGGCGM